MAHVQRSMLSQSVRGSATAPKPWPDAKGYVVVPSPSSSAGTTTSVRSVPAGAGTLKSTGSKSSQSDDAALSTADSSKDRKSAEPGSAISSITTTEEDLLRSALRNMMSHGKATVLYTKRHYVANIGNTANNTEQTRVLNAIAVGAAYNQRVGYQVKCRHLLLKVSVTIYHNSATALSNALPAPCFAFVVKRTLVPAVPGTGENAFAVDTLPPGAGVNLYSYLGATPTGQSDVVRTCVENPAANGTYHHYKTIFLPPQDNEARSKETNGQSQWFFNGTTCYLLPRTFFFEWSIPLDFISTYDATQGNTGPLSNQLELSYLFTQDTNNYTASYITYSAQLDFEDVNTVS